jgi:hypothetical protein
MKSRMLRFRIDADRPLPCRTFARRQLEDLFERRNVELAIVSVRARRVRLPCPECLDLDQREIAREERGYRFSIEGTRGPSTGELGSSRDVGGVIENRLMSRNQVTIASSDQIGFDEVRPVLDSQLIRRQRVFGPITRSATMRDDDGRGTVERAPREVSRG